MALIFLFLTLALTVATVGWMLRHTSRSNAVAGSAEPSVEEMRRHLLWRAFYVNPEDPRGWVPKTSGFGYTVNFRSERNAKIFAALIVATLVSAALQTYFAICA